MKRNLIALGCVVSSLLSACQPPTPSPAPSETPDTIPTAEPSEEPTTTPSPSVRPTATPTAVACATLKENITLTRNGSRVSVPFPETGRFVVESHYSTTADSFSGGRLFPNSSFEGIHTHTDRSCAFLKQKFPSYGLTTCTAIYGSVGNTSHLRQWTPPEGGKAGQAALGDVRPTVEQEIFQGNLMYSGKSAMPKPGTKYIATNTETGQSVVVSMGYEIGPGNTDRWLGGFTPEVFYFLGAVDGTPIRLGRAADQTLAYGPIKCTTTPKELPSEQVPSYAKWDVKKLIRGPNDPKPTHPRN